MFHFWTSPSVFLIDIWATTSFTRRAGFSPSSVGLWFFSLFSMRVLSICSPFLPSTLRYSCIESPFSSSGFLNSFLWPFSFVSVPKMNFPPGVLLLPFSSSDLFFSVIFALGWLHNCLVDSLNFLPTLRSSTTAPSAFLGPASALLTLRPCFAPPLHPVRLRSTFIV